MFFDLTLLKPQHKGALGYAWIAATRGVQHIKDKDLAKLQVENMCMFIMEFLVTESQSPKKRFSLRLAVMLTNGLIKIFRRQAIQLQNELFNILSQIHMPRGITTIQFDETGMFITPPTPIRRIKKKKKPAAKEEVLTPISEIEKIGAEIVKAHFELPMILPPDTDDLSKRVARESDITLQDDITGLPRMIETDVEPLGDVPEFILDKDDFMQKYLEPVSPLSRPAAKIVELPEGEPLQSLTEPSVTLAGTTEEIPQKETTEISKETEKGRKARTPRSRKKRESGSSSSEPQGPIKIQVEAEVHAPPEGYEHIVPQPEETLQKEPEQPSPPPRDRRESPPIQQVPDDILPAEEIGQAEPIRQPIEEELDQQQVPEYVLDQKKDKKAGVLKRKKVKGDPMAPFLVDLRPRRSVCIDRCRPGEIEFSVEEPQETILPRCGISDSVIRSVRAMWLELFPEPELDTVQRGEQSREAGSFQDSLSLRKTVSHGTPAEVTKSSVQRPKRISTPQDTMIGSKIPASVETPMEQLEMPQMPQMPLTSSTPLTTKTAPERDITTEQKTIEETVAAAAKGPSRQLKRKQLIADDSIVPEKPEKKRRVRERDEETAKVPEVQPQLPEVQAQLLEIQPEVPEIEAQLHPHFEEQISTIPDISEKRVVPEITLPPSEAEITRGTFKNEELEQHIREDDIKKRQQDIIDIILNWESKREIEITDVCQRPVNRVNIARAFGDLLVLCKASYVELVPEEEPSIELKYIRRGRKLRSV